MATISRGEAHDCAVGWKVLTHAASVDDANLLFGEFHRFARALVNASIEPIDWRSIACPLSADETLELEMLDHQRCGETRQSLRAAEAPLGNIEFVDVLEAT